jgi:hypothetical protein
MDFKRQSRKLFRPGWIILACDVGLSSTWAMVSLETLPTLESTSQYHQAAANQTALLHLTQRFVIGKHKRQLFVAGPALARSATPATFAAILTDDNIASAIPSSSYPVWEPAGSLPPHSLFISCDSSVLL